MSLGDAILDLGALTRFEDEDESWADKDYGVNYCMSCGAEGQILEQTRFTHTLTCPSCDSGPVTKFRRGATMMLLSGVLVTGALIGLDAPGSLALFGGCVASGVWHYALDTSIAGLLSGDQR